MIYDDIDDVPTDVLQDIIAGFITAGKMLRQWRSFGGFHEMTAQVLSADGPVTIICHYDDRISFINCGHATDITDLVDKGTAGA